MAWGAGNVKKEGAVNGKLRHGRGDRRTLRSDGPMGLSEARGTTSPSVPLVTARSRCRLCNRLRQCTASEEESVPPYDSERRKYPQTRSAIEGTGDRVPFISESLEDFPKLIVFFLRPRVST